jgi:hypothetical protein
VLLSTFAVRLSLPCVICLLHGKEIFAVRGRTAEFASTGTSVFPVVDGVYLWNGSNQCLPLSREIGKTPKVDDVLGPV